MSPIENTTNRSANRPTPPENHRDQDPARGGATFRDTLARQSQRPRGEPRPGAKAGDVAGEEVVTSLEGEPTAAPAEAPMAELGDLPPDLLEALARLETRARLGSLVEVGTVARSMSQADASPSLDVATDPAPTTPRARPPAETESARGNHEARRAAPAREHDGPRPVESTAPLVTSPALPLGGAPRGAMAPPSPTQTASLAGVDLALVQQVVQYAAVTRAPTGHLEFRLGLRREHLGGLRVRVTALGPRRVALDVQGQGLADAAPPVEIASLVDALRARDLEVILMAG